MNGKPAVPDVCAFCLQPVVEHRSERRVGADGVTELVIICPQDELAARRRVTVKG